MDGLNYHHLLYFWKVAKTGSISKASAELQLTQPTISEQIRLLESGLNRKLFDRVGRSLVLTETGHTVYTYAEKIFALGGELTDSLQGVPVSRPATLRIGVDSGVGANIVLHLLAPALRSNPRPVFEIRHDSPENLVVALLAGKLDLVLTTTPPPNHGAHAHLLLDCGTLFVECKRQRSTPAKFPRSLDARPFLFPTQPLAGKLQSWFRSQKLSPQISGTFHSYDDLLAFAGQGLGTFPLPDLKGADTKELRVLGRTDVVRCRFFALTRERRPHDPVLAAVVNTTPRKRR
jgi:LysR family transcriptional activator of nhaA